MHWFFRGLLLEFLGWPIYAGEIWMISVLIVHFNYFPSSPMTVLFVFMAMLWFSYIIATASTCFNARWYERQCGSNGCFAKYGPIFVTGLVASVFFGLCLGRYESSRIADGIISEYNGNISAFNKQYLGAGQQCVNDMYDNYDQFTMPVCYPCRTKSDFEQVTSWWFNTPISVYQVRLIDVDFEFCANTLNEQCQLDLSPEAYQLMSRNFSLNETSGVWPCGGTRGSYDRHVPSTNTLEWEILLFYEKCFNIWAPMDTIAEVDLGGQCTHVTGQATRLFELTSLCFYHPDGAYVDRNLPNIRAPWPFDMVQCVSSDLQAYMGNYTQELAEILAANASLVHPSTSDIDFGTDSTPTIWYLIGGLLFVGIRNIMILMKCNGRCRISRIPARPAPLNIQHQDYQIIADPEIPVVEPEQATPESEQCVICKDRKKCIAFSPCGHIAVCEPCSEHMKVHPNCPICRKVIDSCLKIYP